MYSHYNQWYYHPLLKRLIPEILDVCVCVCACVSLSGVFICACKAYICYSPLSPFSANSYLHQCLLRFLHDCKHWPNTQHVRLSQQRLWDMLYRTLKVNRHFRGIPCLNLCWLLAWFILQPWRRRRHLLWNIDWLQWIAAIFYSCVFLL
jgi:hypothetical protein